MLIHGLDNPHIFNPNTMKNTIKMDNPWYYNTMDKSTEADFSQNFG